MSIDWFSRSVDIKEDARWIKESDAAALIFSVRHTSEHELIGVIRQGEDVRGDLHPLLPSVGSDHLWVVDRQPFVGIHSDTEQPRVGLHGKEMLTFLATLAASVTVCTWSTHQKSRLNIRGADFVVFSLPPLHLQKQKVFIPMTFINVQPLIAQSASK